jgi:hypothetical protein
MGGLLRQRRREGGERGGRHACRQERASIIPTTSKPSVPRRVVRVVPSWRGGSRRYKHAVPTPFLYVWIGSPVSPSHQSSVTMNADYHSSAVLCVYRGGSGGSAVGLPSQERCQLVQRLVVGTSQGTSGGGVLSSRRRLE